MNTEKLLTVKEVAAWLRASEDWVQAHSGRKAPRLPHIRVGKLIRFRREEIERFLEENSASERVQ